MTWGELVIVALSVTTLGLWFFLLAAFACDEIRDADDLEERWTQEDQWR